MYENTVPGAGEVGRRMEAP